MTDDLLHHAVVYGYRSTGSKAFLIQSLIDRMREEGVDLSEIPAQRISLEPKLDTERLVQSLRSQEAEVGAFAPDYSGPNEHGNRAQRRAWKAEQRRAAKRNRNLNAR